MDAGRRRGHRRRARSRGRGGSRGTAAPSSSPALADERQCTCRRSSPGTYSRSAWKARSLIDSCWLVAPSKSLASPPANTASSVTCGDDQQLERPPGLETATHQSHRVGLLVGDGSDVVHPARQHRQGHHLLVVGERREERQAQRHAAPTHGQGHPAGRASAPRPPGLHGPVGAAPAGRPRLRSARAAPGAREHLPRERQQQQPERDERPSSVNSCQFSQARGPGRHHGRGREQTERAPTREGSAAREPSWLRPWPAGWFTRGRAGPAPGRAGRR